MEIIFKNIIFINDDENGIVYESINKIDLGWNIGDKVLVTREGIEEQCSVESIQKGYNYSVDKAIFTIKYHLT